MSFRLHTFRILSHTHGSLNSESISSNKHLRPYGTRQYEAVVTLDPNKFIEKNQQRLHVGNKSVYTARVELHKQSTSGTIQSLPYDRTGRAGTQWPYPPDTKAFLYYTTPPERPRIAGELRFRITSSDDPASFASGTDLLRRNGQLWSRPLYTISKSYIPLYQKLREDRLIPDDLDSILSAIPPKYLMYSLGQLLYTLNDTFVVDFSSDGQYFSVITEQGVETLPFRRQFFDNRESRGGTPYIGSAISRFERSTLPNHRGTRTIVLRFLKIITPVKCVMPLYDGYIAWPKEGELYHRVSYPVKTSQEVWSVNIDKPKGIILPGLRLLWDA